MSNHPLISTVIPVFNRPEQVNHAIESVLSQTYPAVECIVVDDGSYDETPTVLDSFGDEITVITTKNSGVSGARNTGVAHSRGELIAFLDSDDVWQPRKLALQTDHMNAGGYRIGQTEEIWIRNGRRVNRKHRHRKPRGDIFLRSLDLCLVTPSAVIMTRELFETAGGFDESLPACEDYDLWLRLALSESFGLCPEPLVVKYGGHSDQLSAAPGLDWYRILSLSNLLREESLSPDQRTAVMEIFRRKAGIFRNGAEKRSRFSAVRAVDDLIDRTGTQR